MHKILTNYNDYNILNKRFFVENEAQCFMAASLDEIQSEVQYVKYNLNFFLQGREGQSST